MISYITRYTDLSSKRFLLHPHPQKNELLSSWLVRVALAHQTMPWSFMNMHFPEYKNIVFSRDVDIWAPDEFIEKLAWKSGLQASDILNLTLRSYEGYLLEWVRSNGQNFFIAPIISRKRRNIGYGQKYCPICLKEHLVYFKKEWRLTFYTVCLEHKVYMLNRCPNCESSVTLYKFKHDKGFVQCYGCGWHLSQVGSLMTASDEDIARVSRLMKILDDGYVLIGGKPVYSVAFFQVLHQIVKIVKHFDLVEFEEIDEIIGKAEKVVFNLDVLIGKLLEHPKICPSHLMQDLKSVPYFYYSVLSYILENRFK